MVRQCIHQLATRLNGPKQSHDKHYIRSIRASNCHAMSVYVLDFLKYGFVSGTEVHFRKRIVKPRKYEASSGVVCLRSPEDVICFA